MRILAIDYGKAKIGLAIATTPLAEPYRVIRYKKEDELIDKLVGIISSNEIDKVILGVSEGKMAEKIREFGKKLEEKIEEPLVYQDETLSTQDAQRLSLRSGMRRKKRKEMEDAFAASVILQSYLDMQGN